MTEAIKKMRCAVYTRKSSEEGLEQAFNSLDAQREAGAAFIASQKHEGWELITTQYDDGGFSGGSTERPALKLLLADIEAGKIDVIVVYKVDRLSRSLSDFAQMMALFDKYKVSFVSVTQQFNTTTSMGRLTLNILLSFAQFEREVTGERIRDKFAASKKKGMWMGGNPPVGYYVHERHLLIEPKEVELVRKIYTLYIETRSVLKVVEILNKEGYTTKHWKAGSERMHGGKRLTPGYLNHVLRNVIYSGRIRHKKEIYDGQHEAIIAIELWEQVQTFIQKREKESRYKWTSNFLLKGKMRTHEGFVMTPSASHGESELTNKRAIRNRTRYYVSRKAMTQGFASCPIKSLNANLLEDLVKTHLFTLLKNDHPDVYKFILRNENDSERLYWIRHLIDSITIGPDHFVIAISKKSIAGIEREVTVNPFTKESVFDEINLPVVWHKPVIREENGKIILTLSIQIRRANNIRTLLSADGKDLTLPAQPKPDPSIVQAIGRGFQWKQMLDENPDMRFKQFEKKVGYCDSFIARQITLVGLAPDILHRALTGNLPSAINLTRLYEVAESLSWAKQRTLLGLN